MHAKGFQSVAGGIDQVVDLPNRIPVEQAQVPPERSTSFQQAGFAGFIGNSRRTENTLGRQPGVIQNTLNGLNNLFLAGICVTSHAHGKQREMIDDRIGSGLPKRLRNLAAGEHDQLREARSNGLLPLGVPGTPGKAGYLRRQEQVFVRDQSNWLLVDQRRH